MLLLGLAGAVALLVVMCGRSLWPGGGSDGESEQAASLAWPFKAQIPDGFQLSDQRHSRGRTLWILDGPRFGEATANLIVMRSLPETIAGDVRVSPLKAAMLAVDLPMEAPIKGEYRITMTIRDFRSPGAYMLTGPNFGEQLRFPDGSFMSTREAGIVPMSKLGCPEHFIPGKLAAWAGAPHGTLLVVAWAGPVACDGQDIVEGFCRALESESPECYRPPMLEPSIGSPFDKSAPDGYSLQGRTEHEGLGIWVFRGGQTGESEEALIAVYLDTELDKQGIFLPLASCARWAGELAAGVQLSQPYSSIDLDALVMLEKGAGGDQFSLLQPWKTGQQFGFTVQEHLLGLGKPQDGLIRLSVGGNTGGHTSEMVAVSGCVVFGPRPPSWSGVVFAGATSDTSKEGLARIAHAVDDFRATWESKRR